MLVQKAISLPLFSKKEKNGLLDLWVEICWKLGMSIFGVILLFLEFFVNNFIGVCYGRIIYVLCIKIISGQRGVEGRDRKRGLYEPF
jgi:hypothetical protein